MPELYSNFNHRPPPIAITPQLIRALGPHLLACGISAEPDALARALGCPPVRAASFVPRSPLASEGTPDVQPQ